MSLIKFYISYEYLYSPQSWLHKVNDKIKTCLTLLQLVCIPFTPTKYVSIFIIIFISLCKFVHIPKYLRSYFMKIIVLLGFFTLISIKYNSQHYFNQINNRYVLQIYPINILKIGQNTLISELPLNCFYLPISIIRLVSINFIYLFFIKILLLTTKYENITKVIVQQIKRFTNTSKHIITFEIMASSQFLKVIFQQIEFLRIGYITRNIEKRENDKLKRNLLLFLFLLQQFLINIHNNIYSISRTLYSREINYKNLNIYY